MKIKVIIIFTFFISLLFIIGCTPVIDCGEITESNTCLDDAFLECKPAFSYSYMDDMKINFEIIGLYGEECLFGYSYNNNMLMTCKVEKGNVELAISVVNDEELKKQHCAGPMLDMKK
ncbi:hypothetical protein ACFL1H_05380 [Nanoarchaeota archaeon]